MFLVLVFLTFWVYSIQLIIMWFVILYAAETALWIAKCYFTTNTRMRTPSSRGKAKLCCKVDCGICSTRSVQRSPMYFSSLKVYFPSPLKWYSQFHIVPYIFYKLGGVGTFLDINSGSRGLNCVISWQFRSLVGYGNQSFTTNPWCKHGCKSIHFTGSNCNFVSGFIFNYYLLHM